MLTRTLISAVVLAAAALPATSDAQIRAEATPRGFAFSTSREDGRRAVIGVSPSTGSARDTLGILVSSVVAGGPAEKAGIEEGNRIASINGVNLKLSPADIGDDEMASAMSRRLTRELTRIKAGDEVELRVYSSGQTRTVKVKTVEYDDLYRDQFRAFNVDDDDRAVLGVSLGSSGSKRDTLGVLISSLDDEGPAAKAGLEEGNRVVSINGVDLRVPREDAGDAYLAGSKVRRLQREMEKVKPGDEVSLRVYTGGGRTRDLRIKTIAASDLPRRGRSGISIFRGGAEGMPFIMRGGEGAPFVLPMPVPEVRVDVEDLRRRIEEGVRARTYERVAPATRTRIVTNRIVI